MQRRILAHFTLGAGLIILMSTVLHAQIYVSTASYSAGGSIIVSGPSPGGDGLSGSDLHQSFSLTDDDGALTVLPGLSANVGTTANMSVSGSVQAQAGSLKANVVGGWAFNFDQAHPLGEAHLNQATLQARWQDTMVMTGITPGELMHIKASLRLHGSVDANPSSSEPYFGGRALAACQASLSLTSPSTIYGAVIPPGPYGGAWADVRESTDPVFIPVNLLPPETVPVDLYAFAGEPITLDFLMTLRISGTARSTSYYTPGSVSAFIGADFGNTLTWGGISSVTVADTGALVEGWSVSSLSGLDYSRAVPEPAGLLTALLLPLTMRRFRRRREASSRSE